MSEATQEDILAAALAAATSVKVVGGHPDDVEVAALVAGLAAVVGARSHAQDHEHVPTKSQWENRSRQLRASSPAISAPARGADAWRWSMR